VSIGPWWESGHWVHWSETWAPALTGIDALPEVAPTWQIMSGDDIPEPEMKP